MARLTLKIGGRYKVRDPEWCLANDFVAEDTIIGIDETYVRDFIGKSGECYYHNGSIYGEMQKWESDLVQEIIE